MMVSTQCIISGDIRYILIWLHVCLSFDLITPNLGISWRYTSNSIKIHMHEVGHSIVCIKNNYKQPTGIRWDTFTQGNIICCFIKNGKGLYELMWSIFQDILLSEKKKKGSIVCIVCYILCKKGGEIKYIYIRLLGQNQYRKEKLLSLVTHRKSVGMGVAALLTIPFWLLEPCLHIQYINSKHQ